jgi:hypothetical protein
VRSRYLRRSTTPHIPNGLGMWGVGRGTEFRTAGGFFLLMGIRVALEHGFKGLTGRRVGGIWGWAWTMGWTLGWGTLMIDACGLDVGLSLVTTPWIGFDQGHWSSIPSFRMFKDNMIST